MVTETDNTIAKAINYQVTPLMLQGFKMTHESESIKKKKSWK